MLVSPRLKELTSPREIKEAKKIHFRILENEKKEILSNKCIASDILNEGCLLNPKSIELTVADNQCMLIITPDVLDKKTKEIKIIEVDSPRDNILKKTLTKGNEKEKMPYIRYLGLPKDIEINKNQTITISLKADDLNKKLKEKYGAELIKFTDSDLKNLFFTHFLDNMTDFAESKFSKLMGFEKSIIEAFEKHTKGCFDNLSEEELKDLLQEKEKVVIDKDFFLKDLICKNLENLFIRGNGSELSRWENHYKKFLESASAKDLEILVGIMRLGGLPLNNEKSLAVTIKDFFFYMIPSGNEKKEKLYMEKHHLELCLYFAERKLIKNIVSDKEGFEIFIKYATKEDIDKIVKLVKGEKGEESKFVEPTSIERKGRTDSGIDFVKLYGQLLEQLKSKYEIKRKSFSGDFLNITEKSEKIEVPKKRSKSVKEASYNDVFLNEDIIVINEEGMVEESDKKSNESKKSNTSLKNIFSNLSFKLKNRKSTEKSEAHDNKK